MWAANNQKIEKAIWFKQHLLHVHKYQDWMLVDEEQTLLTKKRAFRKRQLIISHKIHKTHLLPDRRLIRPKQRLAQRGGCEHVLVGRCAAVCVAVCVIVGVNVYVSV